MIFASRTEPQAPVRKAHLAMLIGILLVAGGIRLWHLGFGLPSLNDPDEPVFVMTAMDMLRQGRLNPDWFGHPATLLFYLLAVIIVVVGAVGTAIGAWSGTDSFVAAVYADPGVLILPMRFVMAMLGVGSVWVTWAIGRRVGGVRVGLIAALLIACNPLHAEFSQVIRTDMLATLLMGWSLLHALAISRGGGARDYVMAGVAAGLACATKWPAMLVLVAPIAGGLWAGRSDRRAWRLIPLAPGVAVATLLIASPFLLLDWPAVLRDLGGEARPTHLGATGHGLLGNLFWYLRYPLFQSFGASGLLLAVIGAVRLRRDPATAVALLPVAVAILIALAAQSLVWTRWMVPLLPIVAILAALGIGALIERNRIGGVAVALILAAWMGGTALHRQSIRAHDPRQAASGWVMANIPSDRTLLVEHAAFDLLGAGRPLRFPLGDAGCVDVRALLSREPSHRSINDRRTGRAIVDVGNVERSRLSSCAADVLILSNRARYAREPDKFAAQLATYRTLLRGYRHVKMFAGLPPQLPGDDRPVEVFVRR